MGFDNTFSFMTLNMHCGMEENYNEKFAKILEGINDCNPDFIALQECAQGIKSKYIGENNGVKIKEDNQVLKLVNELKEKYNQDYYYYWDWSHYGFKVFEEGLAILSKYPIKNYEARYVSDTESIESWKSRKILKTSIELKNKQQKNYIINIFSVHLGWWIDESNPFRNQADNLINWLNEDKSAINLIAGDFNNAYDTPGYHYFLEKSSFRDLYLEFYPEGAHDFTFIKTAKQAEIENQNQNQRIDFIFTNSKKLKILEMSRIFTEEKYGLVSDHVGIFSKFKI